MGTQRMEESHVLRREIEFEVKGQRKKLEHKGWGKAAYCEGN